MRSTYDLEEADLSRDRDRILDAWSLGLEGLVDDVARSKYRHSYIDNPAGTGACLLLLDQNRQRAVGVQGLIPRAFFLGEKRLDAGTLADFVVAPEHRSLGPALTLMRSCIELSRARFQFVYGTPNEKSRAILNRAGIRSWGALTRHTKLIRSKSYLSARFAPWLSSPMAAIADAVLAGLDLSRNAIAGSRLIWGERATFGVEFDEMWQARPAGLIIGERSSTTLAWRYRLGNAEEWRVSVATEPTRMRPVGYMVWRLINGNAMVSDFYGVEMERSLQTLLSSFAVHLRKFPVQRISLEFLGHPNMSKALVECGFARRERSQVVCVVNSLGSVAPPAVAPDTVFMTSFDRDHEL